MLEATMQVDVVVDSPARMAEALHRVELCPLRGFSIVDLERHHLSNLICATTNDHHERAEEESGMLVARDRAFGLTLVRGFDPVPPAVTVSTQAPSIVKARLVGGTASEANHHSSSTSCCA